MSNGNKCASKKERARARAYSSGVNENVKMSATGLAAHITSHRHTCEYRCLIHRHITCIHTRTHTHICTSAHILYLWIKRWKEEPTKPPQSAQDTHISRDGFLLIAIVHRVEARYLSAVIIYEFTRAKRNCLRCSARKHASGAVRVPI